MASPNGPLTQSQAVPGIVPGITTPPDGAPLELIMSPTSAAASSPSLRAGASFGPGLPNSKRPAPFRKKLTRDLFIRPADQIGKPPTTAESLRHALTYSWINVLLLCNPVAWALHYSNQAAMPTFVVALLGVIPLAGLLGFGTESIALYTGDALGGLINATLGNATEFIIAILLLVKCEIRVVQASLLGGLLSNLLLVLGMAFLVGGIRYSEQEFMQTAAQLNTNLMTLAVTALIFPSAFAFALGSVLDETSEKRVILEMSRGSSIILIIIYITYMVFQLYSHAHYYNPAADTTARYHSSSSSSSSSESSDDERSVYQRVKRRGRKMTGRGSADGNEADVEKKEPSASKLVEEPKATDAPIEAKPKDAEAITKAESKARAKAERKASANADDAVPDAAGKPKRHRPRHLEPPVLAVRRTQSLPFGSAARLGGLKRPPPMIAGNDKHARFDVAYGKSTGVDRAGNRVLSRDFANKTTDLERVASEGSEEEEHERPEANIPVALAILLGSTGLTYLTAEALTDSLEKIGESGSVTPEWLGLILLAVVGNAAEHVTAVFVAYRNKVDLALSVSVGSCIQIALFVIPLLVLIGWIIDKPLSLLFDPLETVTLFLSVLLVRFATEDGRTHYMSGVALVGTYILIAFSFWFYPSKGTTTSGLFDEEVCRTHDY